MKTSTDVIFLIPISIWVAIDKNIIRSQNHFILAWDLDCMHEPLEGA